MRSPLLVDIAGLMAVLLAVAPATSGAAPVTIEQMLGEQDYADGAGNIAFAVPSFQQLGVGEPFPFNGTTSGRDSGGPTEIGSLSYTHTIALGGLAPLSAALTMGLVDHDSHSPSEDTIDVFFDNVQQDDSAFRGDSFGTASASVVTLAVDTALLADGQLTVRVQAYATPRHVGNAIGLDFSRLTVTVAPEPVGGSLTASCVAGIVAVARTANRRHAPKRRRRSMG